MSIQCSHHSLTLLNRIAGAGGGGVVNSIRSSLQGLNDLDNSFSLFMMDVPLDENDRARRIKQIGEYS